MTPKTRNGRGKRLNASKRDRKQFVEIFTDGSCRGNPGPGGFCAILRYGQKIKEISGCEKATTNNRMELTAVIEALRALKRPCNLRITTDSNYVLKGMTQWLPGWISRNWLNSQKKPVLNRDLWEELHKLAQAHTIDWIWIKGHSGHPLNERCDRLAKKAIENCTK